MIIFPIISLVLVATLIKYITRTWSSPGAFFCLCWTFFLIVPIIFASEYKIDHLALWFISIFAMSLASGSIIAYKSNHIQSKQDNTFEFHQNDIFLFYFLIIFSSISFFGLFSLIYFATNIFSSENYVNEWMMIPNLIAIDRYAGVLEYPNYIKYSLYFIYPANLLGGMLFNQNGNSVKIKIFCFLPLLAAILLGIVEGARSSILLGIILFFSAWMSVFNYRQRQTSKLERSYLKYSVVGSSILIVFILFFILIQWLRQGMDTLIIELLVDRIRAYFFGYLSAFSQWLVENAEFNFDYTLITFAGPFNLIGVLERPLGFYDPINITNGVSTNIFTAFRGIITDFSIPGSILIAFIIGFIIQSIYQSVSNKTLLGTLPISMFYAFTLYSPLISIFHYNSILFSWLILFVILIITKNEALDYYS